MYEISVVEIAIVEHDLERCPRAALLEDATAVTQKIDGDDAGHHVHANRRAEPPLKTPNQPQDAPS